MPGFRRCDGSDDVAPALADQRTESQVTSAKTVSAISAYTPIRNTNQPARAGGEGCGSDGSGRKGSGSGSTGAKRKCRSSFAQSAHRRMLIHRPAG